MTDEQFQALSRSFGNLAAAVAKMHTDLTAVKEDLTDLKETVHEASRALPAPYRRSPRSG